MSLIAFIIVSLVLGLFVGGLARLLLPGPDPMSLTMTAFIGIGGSFLAGMFAWFVLGHSGAGLILSVAFSMLLVWLYRRSGGGYARGRGLRRYE